MSTIEELKADLAKLRDEAKLARSGTSSKPNGTISLQKLAFRRAAVTSRPRSRCSLMNFVRLTCV
jgi:hypothetical protein